MKTIEIQADAFFDLLKLKDYSMWDIFAQMIDGEEKQLIFIKDEKILFQYTLPKTEEELKADQKVFAKEYAEKIAHSN